MVMYKVEVGSEVIIETKDEKLARKEFDIAIEKRCKESSGDEILLFREEVESKRSVYLSQLEV